MPDGNMAPPPLRGPLSPRLGENVFGSGDGWVRLWDGSGLRPILARRGEHLVYVAPAAEPVERARQPQLFVRAHQPTADRDVVESRLQALHYLADAGAYTVLVKLKGEVDLLEPGAAQPEQVRPVGDQERRDVGPAGSLSPRQEWPLQDMSRHRRDTIRDASTLRTSMSPIDSAMILTGTCPVFQVAS